MGPGIFFILAAAVLVIALGLMRMVNWARRGASLLVAAAVVGAIPAVSSAVVDFRFATLAQEGLKVIILAAVWFYLQKSGIRAEFR